MNNTMSTSIRYISHLHLLKISTHSMNNIAMEALARLVLFQLCCFFFLQMKLLLYNSVRI